MVVLLESKKFKDRENNLHCTRMKQTKRIKENSPKIVQMWLIQCLASWKFPL